MLIRKSASSLNRKQTPEHNQKSLYSIVPVIVLLKFDELMGVSLHSMASAWRQVREMIVN